MVLYISCFTKCFQLLNLWIKSFSQSDRLTKSYQTLLSSGTPYADFQGDSRFRVCGSSLYSTLLKYCLLCYKATEQYFPMVLSRPFLPGGSNLTSVNEIVEVWSFKRKLLRIPQLGTSHPHPPNPISHSCAALTYSAIPHPSPVSHSPFEPQTAIVKGLLDLCSSRRQAFPAWSRITDSSLRITACNKHTIHTPYNNWQINQFCHQNHFCAVMMYVVLSFESVNTLWCEHSPQVKATE